jgi:hypothetical protein
METKILEQFLYSHKLKFNEIEKALGVRSNKLNYHLQKLVKKDVLVKSGEYYTLSDSSEYLIPYLSNKKHVLTVLLVHIGDAKQAFLIKREKRPYKGKLSLPGGRLIMGESIKEGSERILKKFNIDGKFKGVKSLSLEHLKKGEKVIASYLLIHVGAKSSCDLTNLDKNKKNIIESDYKLITENSKKRLKIETIDSII